MKKKLCVIYGNCVSDGLKHFLEKTRMAEDYQFQIFHNWRLMLNEEETGAQLLEASHACDIFIYQPCKGFSCKDGTVIPPTDQLSLPARSVEGCEAISFPYCFNTGFFPIIKVGEGWDGWISSEFWKREAKGAANGFYRDALIKDYYSDRYPYDCARRFIECLAEQARREQETDIRMVPWILQNYRKQRLFLTYNHPTSALFIELATQVHTVVYGGLDTAMSARVAMLPFESTDENEANMNGVMPIHPAVVRELGLEYQPTDNSIEYYSDLLEQMMRELK